jgi:hypothetical protein
MLQILQAFSSYIDVPAEDLKAGRATPAFAAGTEDGRGEGMRIHSSRDKPADAFAAVRYRGKWFWIDESDLRAKRAMTAVMFFFTLSESGGDEHLPLITIPAQ